MSILLYPDVTGISGLLKINKKSYGYRVVYYPYKNTNTYMIVSIPEYEITDKIIQVNSRTKKRVVYWCRLNEESILTGSRNYISVIDVPIKDIITTELNYAISYI